MAKKVIVGGRIESKEIGGIVTGAAEILDDSKGKKQSVINQETDNELARLDQSKQDNLNFDNAPTEGSNNPVKSAGVYAADKALSDAIEAILLLIPGVASVLNKLVDTATMNSSISTATATFKGTYNVVTDLELAIDATHEQIAAKLGEVITTADNNDYAFVQVPVSAESTDIRRTERYKFNGTAWGYEYDLNTSGFTAAQWAAINSGITLALVGKLIGLPTSSELQVLLGQKQDTLTFDNVPTAGSNNPVKSGGINTAISNEAEARQQLAQSVDGINGRLGNVEEIIPSGAAANNKLVANSSMEAYVASIINAITASFTIATADGHINLTLTQTNGRVASLTLTSSDIASAQDLTALTGRVSTAEGNITSLGGRVSTNETDIANLQQLYNDLQQSKPAPVTALPETGQQQGVIYRLAGTTSYSDYMWNGSTWVLMATYNNAIDPRPKKASQNLVTSGGVFDNMGALDVSELNATENPHTLAQYVDLSDALAAVPTDYQKGGMSIKFVQSSDNKYVQFRCIAQSFTTDITQWQGVDAKPIAGSKNLVESDGVAQELGIESYQKRLTSDDYSNLLWGGTTDGWLDATGQNYNSFIIPLLPNMKVSWSVISGSYSNLYLFDYIPQVGMKTDKVGSVSNSPYTNNTNKTLFLYIGWLGADARVIDVDVEGVGIKEEIKLLQAAITSLQFNFGELEGAVGENTIKTIFANKQIGYPSDTNIFSSNDYFGLFWGGTTDGWLTATSSYNSWVIPIYPKQTMNWSEFGGYVNVRVFDYQPELGKKINFIETIEPSVKAYTNNSDIIKYLYWLLPLPYSYNLPFTKNGSGILDEKGVPQKILLFGDSITQFSELDGEHKRYCDYFKDIISCNVFDGAFGGTRVTKRADVVTEPTSDAEAFANLDIVNLVYAWVNNSWAAVDNAVQYIYDNCAPSDKSSFYKYFGIVTTLKSIRPSEVDAITIMGGSNDWFSGVGQNFGTIDDADDGTSNTFYGAYKYIIRMLLAANPKCKIYILTPIVCWYQSKTDANWSDVKTIWGKTLEDFANACIDIAEYYHLPYKNLYRQLGWNKYNFDAFLRSDVVDLTHPYKGFKQLGICIAKFLDSY